MKYFKSHSEFLNEASRRNVHKAAKQGSYPAVIVVVQDGKVIHQEPVSTPDIAPATFNVMQEKYPKALLHLEDKTGKRLFSESVVTEGEDTIGGLNKMANTDLERIADYADMIKDRMSQGQTLDAWMYSKISDSVKNLNSVHDTMDGNDGVNEARDADLIKQLTDTFDKFKLNRKYEIMMDSLFGGGSKIAVLRKRNTYGGGAMIDTHKKDGGSNYEGYIEILSSRSGRPIPGKSKFDNIDDAMKAATKFVDSIKESAITEARFVKDFDEAVLNATTKKEVEKIYPKAKFFVGKLTHFFGELDNNLFFRAHYAGKNDGSFKIKSVYSKKGSNYVHLFNELGESVVNGISQEGTLLNVLADNQIGGVPATEFQSEHDLDIDAITRAITHTKEINRYELRDIINGTAPKSKIKRFLKQYKR